MKNIIIILSGLVLLVVIVAICFRVRKDIKKKLNFENTYAIQNVLTGKALRPFDAHIENDVEIISYPLKNWECITWEFIEIADNTYLLKDLFTEKTFQPKAEPKEGIGLWQKSLGGSTYQYWEFLKQTDGNFLIKLKGTEFYVTASFDETNSPIILSARRNDNRQLWRLIGQNPWI